MTSDYLQVDNRIRALLGDCQREKKPRHRSPRQEPVSSSLQKVTRKKQLLEELRLDRSSKIHKAGIWKGG